MSERVTFTLQLNDLASGQLATFARNGQSAFDSINKASGGFRGIMGNMGGGRAALLDW